jgi:hypothetical protein
MTVRLTLAHLIVTGTLAMHATQPIWAQEAAAPAGDQSLFGLTFGQVMMLVTNLGMGGIVFIIWLNGLKRQTSMEHLIEKYDETQQAHLAAFKDITENYRTLATDMKNTTLLAIQVQTRLVERLEHTEARRDGK